MRLFVALELPEGVKTELAKVAERFKGIGTDAKWVKQENMHITLKFLGEVQEVMLDEVDKAIRGAVKGVKPFDISLEGAGSFGRPPNVLWVGISKGCEQLVKLIGSLEDGLGFIRKENREPSPHMTLARIRSCRDREGFYREVEKNKVKLFGEFKADAVELKKSVLTPQGPVYSTIETFRLGGDCL